MQFDPRHLRILAAIVDEGGLTEGAAHLGKSQPSVSRTISALEARIGAPLFERRRRPLRPTELGLRLADEGRGVAEAVATAGQVVARHAGGRTGTVRLAGTPIFMDGVISTMVAEFQSAFPDVGIDQSYGHAETLAKRLTVDEIDLAICPLRADGVPDGCAFTPILPGRNVIACAPGHPLARRKTLRLSDLAPYPWIAQPQPSLLYADLRAVLGEIGIEDFKINFSGGSLASITTILAGSQALTVLPYSVVFMQQHLGALAALPIRIPHPVRSLGILTCQERIERPAVRRFRRHVEEAFRSLSRRIVERQRRHIWRR